MLRMAWRASRVRGQLEIRLKFWQMGTTSCGGPGFCRNSLRNTDWPAVEKESVEADPASMSIRVGARTCENEEEVVSLAYLWRETPIQAPVWGAPLYGDNLHRLPSPPQFWEDIGAV